MLRQGLLLWTLWLIASAIGGAIGGSVSEPLEIIGYVLLPGAIVGVAQALVLGRYLSGDLGEKAGTMAMWVAASFVGWFVGWLIFGFVRALLYLTGVPEIAQDAGAAIDQFAGSVSASERVVQFTIWVVFAAFQGAALALAAVAGLVRRSLLPLAALWVFAGAAGGVLVMAAGSVINYFVLTPGGPNLFLDWMVPIAVAEAAAWTLYGATTGVVLAMIARRAAREGGA